MIGDGVASHSMREVTCAFFYNKGSSILGQELIFGGAMFIMGKL